MKRRLSIGLAVAAVVLAAVGVAASFAAKTASTTLTMWSYDNQDPGLEPVLKQLSKQFEASHSGVKINLVFKDFNSLVGTVPRALGQRPRRHRGKPGLPDRRAAREGEVDSPPRQVDQEVPLGQALLAVDVGNVPLDARRQIVRQGTDLGARADRAEHRRLLQQGEAPLSRRDQAPDHVRSFRQAARADPREAAEERAGDRRGQQGGLRLHPSLRWHLGRVRETGERAELDLPRPRLALRLGGNDRGSRQAPAVGKGRVLQLRLQRGRLRRLREPVREGQGRVLDRR